MLRHKRKPAQFLPKGGIMKKWWIAISFVLGVFVGGIGVSRSQQGAAGTQRIMQFENDDVKVWKSVVVPNAPLTMHRHEHGRVIVALKGGTMKIVEQNGASEAHVWETGKAYWLPANAPGTMHADVNAEDQPIEVMVVELKKDK
jgi:beta-alanine degradation protein BauB